MKKNNLFINYFNILLSFFFINLLNNFVIAINYDFNERPQNQSILLGKNAILKCAVPPSNTNFDLQSQWRINTGALLGFHNSGPLPGYRNRYSYVKDGPGELYLQIENITLFDDGKFECQMLRPPNKFLRASSFINVLVPPTEVYFLNYQNFDVIEVNEDSMLNITCVSGISKPEPIINLFVNGKKITDSINKWKIEYENGTVETFSSFFWKPTKKDHNKLLSCEVNHLITNVNLRKSVTLNVLYSSDRPKIDLISTINENNKFKLGENVTLVCSANGGNPPPRLLWSNQAGLINSSFDYDFTNKITRNVYTFLAKDIDNNAVYECSSSNRENVVPLKKSIIISVDYPPTTVYLYGSTAVRKGDSVIVTCSTSLSSPPSIISWKINGSPTKMQKQIEKRQMHGFVTESNITIDSNILLSGQNQIIVECSATNNESLLVSNQHIIRVLTPPSLPIIYEGIETSTFFEGSILNLTCEAQGGHPLATLTWYRGVEKLKESYGSNEGDVSRSIVSIQLDRSMNQQQIRCEAENGATDQPLIAKKTLSVYFPPNHMKIYQMDGSHQHMIADIPNRLRCHVPSSNPPADISWEFINQLTLNSNQTSIAKSGQYTKRSNKPNGEYKGYEVENVIEFTPTEDMDKSVTKCIASHPQWNGIKTTSFILDVLYPPRIPIEEPITIVIGEGESFEENLTIHANPKATNFQWRKNGVSIERGGLGAIYVRGSTIGGKSVTKDDAGIYTLNAANRIGMTNLSLILTVEYAAYVTYITSPVIAGVGEDVVLECEADGFPIKQGMVKWMHGNREIKSVIQDQKRAVLRLNASHENGGIYTCIADNGIGRRNSTLAYLLVRRAPIILRSPELDRAAGPLGGRAILKCRAMGIPNVEFSWSIEGDGQIIARNSSKYKFYDYQIDYSSFQSSLIILNLEERDYSLKYRCRASNRLGLVQTTISLGPPSNPDIPLQFQVINVTDTSALLGWIPGFDGGYNQFFEIRYYIVGHSQVYSINSSEAHIILNDLKMKETYKAQIRSINSNGRLSKFSFPPIQFNTLDENMQEVYQIASNNVSSFLSPTIMFIILIFFIILLILNLIMVCLCRRKHNIKKYQEKTELARTLNQKNDGSSRPIQIYGTLISKTESSRRPDSNNTNKSELNEQITIEDNQSARTIIEVNQNGYIMANQGLNPNYYDTQCIVDYDNQDFYSPINKPLLGNTTYTSMPYPEPPNNNLHIYSNNIGTHLGIESSSPSPHRNTFNQINNNTNNYNTLKKRSLICPENNNTILMSIDQNSILNSNNNTGNYLTTGAYNSQTNLFSGNNGTFTTANNGSGLIVSNAIGNYDSLRSYNGYQLSNNNNNNRSPRMLSTFSNNNSQNNTYINDINLHNQQKQHLLSNNNNSDIIEGDIV